ncbi:MAG: N-acetylmuramoyl-L-alanine amidase [Blautia sp.]|nr:N-acetylmuramoyl-L-alanine amidase [Blautia sp.]
MKKAYSGKRSRNIFSYMLAAVLLLTALFAASVFAEDDHHPEPPPAEETAENNNLSGEGTIGESASADGFVTDLSNEGVLSQSGNSGESIFSQATAGVLNPSNPHIVAIDPGHQGFNVDMSEKEPNAPGSSDMKVKCTTGTQGSYTGLGEYQLNLDVSLRIRDILEDRGYTVIMTRTDNDTAISNAERAQLASKAGAEIYVRIHANGDDSHTMSGALTMCMTPENPYVGHLYEDSRRLSELLLKSYCEATGFQALSIMEVDNMTGINWSSIPVTIIEMGFMSNEYDDTQMANSEFQDVMATGIADGIDDYFGIDRNSSQLDNMIPTLQNDLSQLGGTWAAYVCDLSTGAEAGIGPAPMQAASLIKLFIMGAVYEDYDRLAAAYGSSVIDSALYSMITVSDNDCANQLTSYLGGGDSGAGMARVNQFCANHGYTTTSMGRLLLASNEYGDNYTSVYDCGAFLRGVYDKSLTGADSMFNLLAQQQRRHKIPAQLPEGVHTASKTGELADVENDVAILYDTPCGKDLIICFMSENLSDPGNAQSFIAYESARIYKYFAG